MNGDSTSIGWLSADGSAYRIGLAAGRRGRDAVHDRLLPSAIWRRVIALAHGGRTARMAATTQALFPSIWEELRGLADGLELPFDDVFAWNCRGDLLASAPDGCTTLQLPGPRMRIAHNEDGLPFFRGHCFILDAAPQGQPAFRAFCYPGSIAGHTFAVTARGLAQAVNNIRLRDIEPAVPRMVLGRAVLAADTLDAAVDLLAAAPASGGFHFSLACQGDTRLLGVEIGAGSLAVREITEPALHANHALFHTRSLERQIVTRSSGDRQARGDALLAEGRRDPLAILRDTGGAGLPIFRAEPDDPDHENTMAIAVLTVERDRIGWRIYDPATSRPAYAADWDALDAMPAPLAASR